MARPVFLFVLFVTTLATSISPDSSCAQDFDKQTEWNGFEQFHFTVEGRAAYFIAPESPASGNPWVWRARFPGYHAEMDIELLRRGMHVGYVDVAGLFGCPTAVAIGDAFYNRMTQSHGMNTRPALEGVSRGGLFVYNWAAANPDKVACIYCDTPVLDPRSWPGGVGEGVGAANEWQQCLTSYDLAEEDADSFGWRLSDRSAVIAHAGIPILHIVSENDVVVPPVENTYVVQRQLAESGHPLQVISLAEGTEQSQGHHFDHPDPDRVVDFIAGNAAATTSHGVEILKNARRVLFLGDSITYGGGYVAEFETWLERAHPDSERVVINAALPSETVSGLSENGHAGGRFPRPDLAERLDRVLESVAPDLVIACYGINCGIYQPFDEQRFESFRNGIDRLRVKVEAKGARLVLVTPPTFDNLQSKNEFDYDAVMQRYSQWLLAQRLGGKFVVDLHSTMARELLQRRQADPSFTFQPDSVHVNDDGNSLIASHLIDWFSGGENDSAESPDSLGEDVRINLKDLVRQRMNIRRNAWLTHTGHQRPGIADGLPLDEAQRKAAELTKQIRAILD